MLKKKKTTASGEPVMVQSVRRTRSHRMKFCVQRGLGALPSTSKAEGKITAGFFPLRAECINTGIACYNEFATMSLTLKGRGKNALLRGSYPSYNEGVIGLTGHCLSFYARTGKL